VALKNEEWGSEVVERRNVNISVPCELMEKCRGYCDDVGIPFSVLVCSLLRLYLDKDVGGFGEDVEAFVRNVRKVRGKRKG